MFPKFIATASNFRTVSSLWTTIRGRLMLTSLSAESTSMRYTFATPPTRQKRKKRCLSPLAPGCGCVSGFNDEGATQIHPTRCVTQVF